LPRGRSGEGADAPCFGEEGVPGFEAPVDDGVGIVEHARAQEALAQIEPDAVASIVLRARAAAGAGFLGSKADTHQS